MVGTARLELWLQIAQPKVGQLGAEGTRITCICMAGECVGIRTPGKETDMVIPFQCMIPTPPFHRHLAYS